MNFKRKKIRILMKNFEKQNMSKLIIFTEDFKFRLYLESKKNYKLEI